MAERMNNFRHNNFIELTICQVENCPDEFIGRDIHGHCASETTAILRVSRAVDKKGQEEKTSAPQSCARCFHWEMLHLLWAR